MLQFPKEKEHRQKWIFFKYLPSQWWKRFYFHSATVASWKERVLSLLQQKMLVEASEVSFAGNEQDVCTPKDAVEVEWLYKFFLEKWGDNINEIFREDANVTYFDSSYIGCSICLRRKCTDCKVLFWVIAKDRNKLLKRCCVFLLHQLLSLTSVVPKTMKTLHRFSKPLSIALQITN